MGSRRTEAVKPIYIPIENDEDINIVKELDQMEFATAKWLEACSDEEVKELFNLNA